MTDTEKREAARRFYSKWHHRGNEDEDARSYWIELLSVLGMENVTDRVDFEKKVIGGDGNTKRIDAYIPETHVIIEQKSLGIKLDKPQAGHGGKTPYEQAKYYDDFLPFSEKARWIITSNFEEIWIYDMDSRVPEPEKLTLSELPTKLTKLDFLIRKEIKKISKEEKASKKAGDLVGLIYDALYKQYDIKEPSKDESDDERKIREGKLKSLNVLCVRLVFCLYAEDAPDIFGKNMFHDFLLSFSAREMRRALIELFKVLDTPVENRDPYLEDEFKNFPYVNGGLFHDESIEIPQFTDEIRTLIIEKASEGNDWSEISPTIFGAIFESTLNPETRRKGGMHYTSITNIHKVIDPLFLDSLKEELVRIEAEGVASQRNKKLKAFQEKIAALEFFDPAAGSGNFLTESYISIRRLENRVIKDLRGNQISLSETENPIKVSINQFHGIEINDFAVTVAKTALWIAESQMLEETKEILYSNNLSFLPLKTNANIVEGNALTLNWEKVVDKEKLNYIMGNPPFVGNARLSDSQKKDRENIFQGIKDNIGDLDYVCCWYKKTAEFTKGTKIHAAFVSTNSICQGQQVVPLWKNLFEQGIKINFAYKTFVWDSEANEKAHVYCIIVGFSHEADAEKYLFTTNYLKTENGTVEKISKERAENINAYLMDAPDVFIGKRRIPLCSVPAVIYGIKPADNGKLILSDEEKVELIKQEPNCEKWIKPFVTAKEYLYRKNRWCLWLVGISPAELNSMPKVKERIKECKEWREKQVKTGDAYRLKDMPTLMRPSAKFHFGEFVVIPRVTGERRSYVPFGFVKEGSIPGDSIMLALDATLYHFGVLESNIHMAWMRAVCGRLKGDYRYSSDIVYNNFPWPTPTEDEKAEIEKTAQGILDARNLFPDSSLADLYDPLTMPLELLKAHQKNDKAVMRAYGFDIKTTTESTCVASLMKMYEELLSENNK